ncbi:hypothetical protein J3R82DRAFT_7907 [Butyriboletus roseoflavus]|nr:hypothetical protein J3R82DRAFT_7907 [Butyriboletus roseoflavus]
MTRRPTATCSFSKRDSRPTLHHCSVENRVINVKHRSSLRVPELTYRAVFLLHLVLTYPIPTSFGILSQTVYGTVRSVKPHPYFPSGLLFVAITSLLLFFASGMYSEKIAYANRYDALLFEPPSEHSDHERFSKLRPSRKQSIAVPQHVSQRPQASVAV